MIRLRWTDSLTALSLPSHLRDPNHRGKASNEMVEERIELLDFITTVANDRDEQLFENCLIDVTDMI
jgi:hypothetical protein